MRAEGTFLASADVARRAGAIGTSYRTKDGRFVISEKALRSLQMKPEEYVSGLDVELISEQEAERLIAENGYKYGTDEQSKANQ